MSGALKAGGVYVAVSASIGEFTKSMQQVLKTVEATAAKVRAAAQAIGNVGLVFAAGIAGAVQQAAKANLSMDADVRRLQKLLYTLAGDLGDLFAPALKQIIRVVDGVVAAIQRMSPQTKASMATFAEWVAGAGLAAKAIGTGAGVVEGLAKAASLTLVPALKGATAATKALGALSAEGFPTFKGLFAGLTSGASSAASSIRKLASDGLPSINQLAGSLKGAASSAGSGISSMMQGLKESTSGALSSIWQVGKSLLAVVGPVLLGVAAVGALALAAGAVYAAWTDTSTGLKDSVMSAVESLKGYAVKLAGFFRDVFQGIQNFFLGLMAGLLDVMLVQVKTLASALEKLAQAAHADNIAKNLAQIQDLTGEKIISALQDRMVQAGNAAGDALAKGVAFVADVGKDAAKNVSDSFSYSAQGLKKLLGDTYKSSGLDKLVAQAEGLVQQLTGGSGHQAKLRAEAPEVEVKMADKDPVPDYVLHLARGVDPVMEAYKDMMKARAKALADAVLEAQKAIKDRLKAALGPVTELVDTFKQGTAAAGGNPLAGVANVALDLLLKSKGFQEVMQMVTNTIQSVSDVLGTLLEALEPLVGAALRIVTVVAGSLKPVFQLVGKFLEPLVPVLILVGDVLQVLNPIIKMVAGALELLMLPMKLIGEVALRALFEALKYLGAGLIAVAKGIAWVWNGIVSGVQWVLQGLAKLPLLDSLKDAAKALDSIKIDTSSLSDAQQKLLATTWDMADAQGAAAAAQLKNTQALNDATESLSNVPAMWRKTMATRLAQDPQGGSSGLGPVTAGGVYGAPQPAPSTPAPAPQPTPVVINVTAHNTEQVAQAIQDHLADRDIRRGGNKYGGGQTP